MPEGSIRKLIIVVFAIVVMTGLLVDSAAQKLASDFFAKFNELAQQAAPTAAQLSPPSPTLLPQNDRTRERANGSTWRWFTAFALGTSALLVWIWFSSR